MLPSVRRAPAARSASSRPANGRNARRRNNDAWGGGFGPFITEKNRLTDQWWGCEAREDDSVFPDVKNADAVIEFLQREHDQPFFAVYGLWRPHTPFTAPKRFFDLYNLDDIKVPVPAWRKDDLDDVPEIGRKLTEPWGERYKLCGESNLPLWRQFVRGYCA